MPGVRLGAGDAWWRGLAAAGLERERWKQLPKPARRAIVLGVVGLLALAILAPIYGFDPAAFYVFLVLFALLVPPWRAVPYVGRFLVPLGVLALAVVYPYYTTTAGATDPGKLFTIPILGPFPNMDTMVAMGIFTMMAIGLNMVVGYAGLLDLGYVAFYAIGAYTAAWFASPHFSDVDVAFGAIGVGFGVQGYHISVWLLLLVAAAFTAVAGVIIGLPTLRLRGDYLAIVTLGFGEILPQVARNGSDLGGFNLTNGPQGINPIDPPGFGKTLHDAIGLPENYATAANVLNVYYWTTIVLVLITVFCSIRLRDSRLGRAWIAVREDEVAAAAMGVPLMRTKTWAYAAGAFFGGIAGAYFASFKGGVFPDDFFFNISVFILCMVILGGMGNVWGVILGACILVYLNQEGIANIGGWINSNFGTAIDLPLYAFGIYGAIILIIMLFRPQGLIPSERRKAELEQGVHDEPLMDVTR